jgi:four helix bundle protein
MTTAELKARTKEFALRVNRLVDALPNTVKGRAPSIAANYRAPCRARSRAEFIAKIGVVEEEADETAFWLELIIDSDSWEDANRTFAERSKRTGRDHGGVA